MKLEGHHGEVWSLAVSSLGDFVVSAGHDRSIRVWERTEEQLFLEEEREKELETLFESSLEETGRGGKGQVDGEEEVDRAGRRTLETVKAGERIIDALEIAEEEENKAKVYQAELAAAGPGAKVAPPTVHPLLTATNSKTPAQYVLHVVAGIPSAELEEALLVLPFNHILQLIGCIDEWFTKVALAPAPAFAAKCTEQATHPYTPRGIGRLSPPAEMARGALLPRALPAAAAAPGPADRAPRPAAAAGRAPDQGARRALGLPGHGRLQPGRAAVPAARLGDVGLGQHLRRTDVPGRRPLCKADQARVGVSQHCTYDRMQKQSTLHVAILVRP